MKKPNCGTRQSASSGIRPKLFWILISVVIGAASILAVLAQAKEVSIRSILARLSAADPLWLTAAVLGMLGFIFFEACAIHCTCSGLNDRPSMRNSWTYATADIYFSAITPSATGGQPASAYFMMQDGMSGATTTAALLLNLSMYTLSIIVIGVVALAGKFSVLMKFSTLSIVLIVVGCLVQLALAAFFFLLVKNKALLQRLCSGTLRLLDRLHMVKRERALQEKLTRIMDEYRECASLLVGKQTLLWKVFLFNFLQRASQFSVTMSVYMALGGGSATSLDMWALQSFVVLGSNYIPIPGGMGVTDFLMLDAFGAYMSPAQAVDLELIARSLSFYCCIILCGIAILSRFLWNKYKEKRHSL